MSKQKVTCGCGKSVVVSSEHAGKQFACKACGTKLVVPGRDEEASFDDVSEDDYGELPAALPPARRKKKLSGSQSVKGNKSSAKQAGVPKALIVGAGLAAFLVAAVGGYFAVRSMLSNSGAGGGKASESVAEKPVTYEKVRHEVASLGCEFPTGWEATQSGGFGGKPSTMRFTDGTAMISCRESVSGSAMGDIAKITGGGARSDDLDPVVTVHDFQLSKMQDEYSDYKESKPEVREIRLGDARVSAFTASESFSSIAGYRMTALNNLTQFNIVCKCPKSKLKQYDAIFQHVLGSFER